MESLQKQLYDVNIKSVAHKLTADHYTSVAAYIKVPGIALAVLQTVITTLFAILEMQNITTQIITAALSALLLIMTSVSTYLAYGETAVKHSLMARQFEKLSIKVKKYRNMNYNEENLKEKLGKISDDFSEIVTTSSLRLPIKFEKEAIQYQKEIQQFIV